MGLAAECLLPPSAVDGCKACSKAQEMHSLSSQSGFADKGYVTQVIPLKLVEPGVQHLARAHSWFPALAKVPSSCRHSQALSLFVAYVLLDRAELKARTTCTCCFAGRLDLHSCDGNNPWRARGHHTALYGHPR